MASVKLSALVAIAAASISATDILPITDADAGTPTTYKTSIAQLRTALLEGAVGTGWGATDYLGLGAGTVPSTGMIRSGQGAITADSPLINSTATWNNVAITFRHILVNVTDTTSAAGSLFADFQIAGASKWALTKGGAVTQALGLTVTAGGVTVSAGTTAVQALTATSASLSAASSVSVATGTTLTLNTTNNVAGDFQQIVMSRGGVGKWRVGVNIVGTNVDEFNVYSEGAAVYPIRITTAGAVTLSSTLAVASHITLSANATSVRGTTTGAATVNLLSLTADANNITRFLAGVDAGGFQWTNQAASVSWMTLTSAGILTVAAGATITAGGLAVSAGTTAVQALTATTGVFAGAVSGVTTLSCTTVTATNLGGTLSTAAQTSVTSVGTLTSLTTSGAVTMTAAAAKLIPGATSFSHRNNADSADNLLISDAGAVTIRSTLTVSAGGVTVTAGGITVTGASTITGTLGGVTTLTATTLAGTLSTAAQANVTSLGTLTGLTVNGDVVYSGQGLTRPNAVGAVSVAGVPTAICTIAGTYARVEVFGYDGSANAFRDVVVFSGGGAATVVTSTTVLGAPTARTYSVATTSLRLLMASGTYTVRGHGLAA